MIDRITEVAARVKDIVLNKMEGVGKAVVREVASVADTLSRGDVREVLRDLNESVDRITEAVEQSTRSFLEEVGHVTGLDVPVGSLLEAIEAAGHFLCDALTGEIDVPLSKALPILVCVVAAGAFAYRGDMGNATRFLMLAFEGVEDLSQDFEHAEDMQPYRLPEELYDVRVRAEDRPFDLGKMERELKALLGERASLRSYAEEAQPAQDTNER